MVYRGDARLCRRVGRQSERYHRDHVTPRASRNDGHTMRTLNPGDGFHAPQESTRVLATILEKSDDAIIHTDLDGVITGWSAGAARLYGYSAEETIGSSLGLLIPDEKWGEFTTMLDRVRWGVSVDRHETVRRAKNGRLLDVGSNGRSRRVANGD